jgi:predicted alpha/beta hydrolase family esterase
MGSNRSIRCLIVPGLDCSGPDHWQTLWEQRRDDCHRVEMGCWNDPARDMWIDGLDHALRAASEVVLVAHSLGCLAVAWWAAVAAPDRLGRVRGAMLVAPPDVDRRDADPRLRRFAPTPSIALPFPTILVASHDDHYATFDRSRAMAEAWGADLVDVGHAGHINASSGLGDWPAGRHLLDRLIDRASTAIATSNRAWPETPATMPLRTEIRVER